LICGLHSQELKFSPKGYTMNRDHRRVHLHQSHMDTCPDCIRQAQAERYRFTQHGGGDRGGIVPRIVAVHPAPVFAQVYNEATGTLRWFEVDQQTLIDLLDKNLTGELG
jgi:hypothetical protein